MNGHRQIQLRRAARRRSLRGFTAVEIAMVATVIAIIALLVLPVFRSRTEEARKAGALDELASLAKAQLLAEADVNIQIRLQDMDNGLEDGNPASVSDIEPPIAQWNGTLETASVPKTRSTILDEGKWGGPYASYKSYKVLDDLQRYWYGDQGPTAGFIYVVDGSAFGPSYPGPVNDVTSDDRYPVDPWGNPYVFYGLGRFPAFEPTESTFNSSILVSFGPNGVVANSQDITISPLLYRRYNPANPSETGLIGWDPGDVALSDDIVYRF